MDIPFSERQARTIAAAVTTIAAVVILLAIGFTGWVTARFLSYFSGVFLPLAVGAIAALVCRPYYAWLSARLRLPAAAAVAAVFLTAIIPLGGFAWFFGQMLVSQVVEMVTNLPGYIDTLKARIEADLPRAVEMLEASGLDERLREVLMNRQASLAQGLQQVGTSAFSFGVSAVRAVTAMLGWAILPVYFAYFLTAEGTRLEVDKLLPFLKSDSRRDVSYLLNEFVDIIVAFFRGQLIIAFLQGMLYAAGFTAIGLSYGFVIGLLLGMMNIIPYLGSIIGLAIAIPVSLLQTGGGGSMLLMALAVILVVQQIEGWFLTPKIMGDRTGLHFMAIIVAIFFWGTALGGILGMILAIPLTAFLASFWRLVRDKYIAEIL